MANYLDTTGLQSLWEKIKSLVSGVSDEVTTVKNNYISKVWFNMFGKTNYQTKLTSYLSPATEAELHDGVSNADIGIFASAPLVLGYNSKQNTEGTDVLQTMVIAMQKASSAQDGYMTKEMVALISDLQERVAALETEVERLIGEAQGS